MEAFETKPKHWGNSLGITIPKEIVKKAGLSERTEVRVLLLRKEPSADLQKVFGTLKLKKPTQQVMDEIDAEAYE